MNTLSPVTVKRFLATAALALAIPLTVAASPGPQRDAGGPGECAAMEGRGGPAGRMERPMMGPGEMAPHHLRGINLSEAQRDKVFEIMHAQAPVMREKAKLVGKAEESLRKLAAAPDYSDAKVKSLADALGKAQSEVTLNRVRTDHQVFEVLTPEQRQQLADMKAPGEPPRNANDVSRGMVGDARTPPVR